ncbi:MAG: adenylyl-sulfate kinase [Pseudomonadota bacterium]
MTHAFIIASESARSEGRIECPDIAQFAGDLDPLLLKARVLIVYAAGLDLQKTLLTCRVLAPERVVVVADPDEAQVASDASGHLDLDIQTISPEHFDADTVIALAADVDEPAFRAIVQRVDEHVIRCRRLSGGLTVGDQVQPATSGSGRHFDLTSFETRGDEVSISLVSREHAIKPGEVLCRVGELPEVSDQFKAEIVWLSPDDGFEGRRYDIEIGNQHCGATVSELKHRYDPHSYQHLSARKIRTGDCVSVTLGLSQEIVFDTVTRSRSLATFILRDHYSNDVVAMGVLSHSLRRAQNVHRQELSIQRDDRERLNNHKGAVVWFTGLSGSGKSTVANGVEQELHRHGVRTYVLDGDNVRHGLNKDLGFTDADRVENIRRVAEVSRLMVDAGLVVLTSFISPFRSERDLARQLFSEDEFFEVYVNVPLAVAETRDPKGLYRKARAGEIPNFTGIDSDYEPPISPELEVRTDKLILSDCVDAVCELLTKNNISSRWRSDPKQGR